MYTLHLSWVNLLRKRPLQLLWFGSSFMLLRNAFILCMTNNMKNMRITDCEELRVYSLQKSSDPSYLLINHPGFLKCKIYARRVLEIGMQFSRCNLDSIRSSTERKVAKNIQRFWQISSHKDIRHKEDSLWGYEGIPRIASYKPHQSYIS